MTISRDSKTDTPLRSFVQNFCFYFGLGLLFAHELDAMANHEWRVLPVLGMLPDAAARSVFVIAHVPAFALVIAFVASLDAWTRWLARTLAGAFLILHAGLHVAFSGAATYEFASPLSAALIYGAAVCGAIFLVAGGGSEPAAGRR